ncbi:MAG: DUF835 domain-containing protein [Euryarchaeota archaeon]|nr:DUF835 domain-containing protein [Euryarchaeota archaeon]
MLFFSMPFLSLAILKYKLLATPVSETPSQAPARHTLPPGHLYLAKEERPRRSLEVFTDLATHDTHGLAITRTPPQTIRDEWKLEKTPILWLGEKPPTPDIPAVDSIEELYYNIGEFLRKSQNSVILIDGLEYLIQTHDFNKVLRMLYRLKEQMVAHHSRLILPVDPRTLGEREMALLERETEGLG